MSPPISCETVGKFLNCSMSQFPHLENKDNNSTSPGVFAKIEQDHICNNLRQCHVYRKQLIFIIINFYILILHLLLIFPFLPPDPWNMLIEFLIHPVHQHTFTECLYVDGRYPVLRGCLTPSKRSLFSLFMG